MSPWDRARYTVPFLRESHVYQLALEGARRTFQSIAELWARLQGESRIPHEYEPEYDDVTQLIVADVKRLFAGMNRIARERSVPLVVMMIPEFNQVQRRQGFIERGADLDKPQRIFADFFEAEGIPYLDLLEGVREQGPSIYYRQDQHFTPEGQAYVAARLAEFLERRGLLAVESGAARQ